MRAKREVLGFLRGRLGTCGQATERTIFPKEDSGAPQHGLVFAKRPFGFSGIPLLRRPGSLGVSTLPRPGFPLKSDGVAEEYCRKHRYQMLGPVYISIVSAPRHSWI